MKTMTDAQKRLLAKLDPRGFFLVEDFRHSNCPGTQVEDSSGRYAFTFGNGDARAFNSLRRADVVAKVETMPSPKDFFRTRYVVA